MAFAASGNVIPATGNINFNSNASSNAVRQVFGEATSNMQGLVTSNYNTSSRPPPFTVTTANQVPGAASGNLKLSFFAGKSLFLTSPTTYTISNITTSNVTPTLSGSGTSYYIAVGTAAGGSTLTNGWVSATSGTAITKQTDGSTNLSFTVGSNYYISAYASNTTKSTSSLAVSNTSAFGIPKPATGVTLTITSLTSWSMSWTAPSTGIAPSGYSWSISTSSTVPNGTAGYFGTTTSAVSASGTAALTGGSTYYATVYATRPESTSVIAASTGVVSLSAPGSFTIISMTTTVVDFQWTAVSGATSYTLTYSGTSSGTVTGIPAGSTYTWTHGFTSGGWTCTLAAVAGGTGPSSVAAYFGVFITPTTSATYTPPVAKTYIVEVSGAGGGAANASYQSTAGSGGIIRASGSLAATAYTVQVGGAGGAGTAGINGGGTGGNTGLGPVAGGGGGFSQFGTRGAFLSITGGGGGGASYSSGGMVDDNGTESYAVGNGGNGGVRTTFNGTAGQTQSISNSYTCSSGCYPVFYSSTATATGGGGGTQIAVGAGGSGGTAGSTTTGGTGGAGYKNYSGFKSAAGGGGGGGYYGGGGGGWDIENIGGNLGESVASGGGGGSSFRGVSFSSDFSGAGTGAGAGVNGWVLIYG